MKAIITKYIPATNTKPSRVKAWTEGGNSVTIGYNSDNDNPFRVAAEKLCAKMQWPGRLIEGGTGNGSVFVFAEPEHAEDVSIRFESQEDAHNFKKWAAKQMIAKDAEDYRHQVSGPSLSIAMAAVGRAKSVI
jgi:hypothetical protein